MVVQHNLTAINANRYLGINNNKLSKSLEKLASGYQINRAGDNAAGLAVSEKMRSQIAGMTQGVKNAQDGISMVQTYEGALTETHSILQRMKTLADQAANGTYQDDVDRDAIQLEFDQLNDELNQIADTDFNGVVVLNGGEMADGVKADGYGHINYATAVRQAQQLGTAGGFVKAIDTAKYLGTNEETVTFTASIDANGKVTWKEDSGALQQAVNAVTTDVNGKAMGGFKYDEAVVVIDTSKVVAGDTVTITFGKKAPAAGYCAGTVGSNVDYGTSGATGLADGTGKLEFATDISSGAAITSQEIADAINALNGLTISGTSEKASADLSDIKVNGITPPTAADTYTEIAKVGDGKLTVDKNKKIYYEDKKGARTELASYTVGTLAANATAAGTVTQTFNVGQATYTPAKKDSVKLVEPNSKVSQSNAYEKSTTTLTYSSSIALQAGARSKDIVDFTFNYKSNGLGDLKANMNCSAREDGLNTASLSLRTSKDANAAIDKIDQAINKVSMVRATFGSIQNRLEHKIDNMNVSIENLTSAESQIRDTDMPKEMMEFTKNQILAQAAQSMLAQANQMPQGVLSLLQ